jgi:hypothetical protein
MTGGAERSVHEDTTEEGIANAAWDLAGSQHDRVIGAYQIEMIRRNNVALRAFNASSDRWSRRILILTVVLVVFTAVLIGVAIETAYLAWVLLERSR